MAYWDNEKEIGIVPKNKLEQTKISFAELKGKKYLSITNLKETDGNVKPIGGTSIVITDELKKLWPEITKVVMGDSQEIKEEV